MHMSASSQSPLAGPPVAFLVAVLVLLGPARAQAAASVDASKFAAIVMDASTGEVLYEYEPDARRFPYS